MNLEEARALLQSTTFCNKMADMDDATDTAVQTFDRTIARMGPYSSSVQTEYRRAASALDAAQRSFTNEVNAIVAGRARDGRAALAAFRSFETSLRALRAMNAMNSAMVEADVARFLEAVFTAGARFTSSTIRRETRAMQRDLTRLRDRLRTAQRELTGAEAQRIINGALSAIGLILGFFTGVEEVAAAFAVGSAATSTALDAALGPGSPDVYGGANTAFGFLPNLVRQPSVLDTTLLGAFTGVIGFMADCSEVELARANLTGAENDLRRAAALFSRYARHIKSEASALTIAKRLADGAIRDARARARTYREARDEFRDVERGLADIRGV